MKKSQTLMVGMVLFILSGCAAQSANTTGPSTSQEQTEGIDPITSVLIDVAMEAYKDLAQEKQERIAASGSGCVMASAARSTTPMNPSPSSWP